MKGKRWLERGKSLLIALLTLSAVYLLTMTPLVQDSGLLELLNPPEPAGSGPSGPARVTAALPARMAVNTPSGRYGLQYDQDSLDELFARMGPLLGEALASSGQAQGISEQKWREYLKGTGIYFDFSGQTPLSALGAWLREGGQCSLPGSARRFLLAADGEDGVALCWQDESGGEFYACPTSLTQRFHLEPAMESFSGNGAFFAFEDSGMARTLKPYTLVTGGAQTAGRNYAVDDPLSASGAVDSLLNALSFSGRNHVTVSGGEAYLDGNDRLEVGSGGTVTYRAARGEKYPACSGWGTAEAEAEAIATAWKLAEASVGSMCGEAQLYLISAQTQANGYQVRFGYRLNGSDVRLRDGGWAAEFWIQNGYVTKFTLHFRSYTATAEEDLLLPVDRAAAMLPDLTKEKVELVIQYRDAGGAAVVPEWIMA